MRPKFDVDEIVLALNHADVPSPWFADAMTCLPMAHLFLHV